MFAQPAPSLNRTIAALAVPALGALLAEPAFLLADAAIVGHLGTEQLAAWAIKQLVRACSARIENDILLNDG